MWRLSLVMVVALAFGSSCKSWFSKPVANAETSNANVAENPFANITDANQALAEGKRLLDENDTAGAIAVLERAVDIDPNLPEAHFQLGIAYGLMDLQNEQAGNILPGDNEARVKTRADRQFDKAAYAYTKYLDANPKDDAAWFNLGRTYVKLLKDDKAEDAFREAVKLKADDTDYQTELGAILIRLAKYHEAVAPLKKAIEIDPTNARAQDLLEDAQAGVKRLDYVSNSNGNSNSRPISNSNVSSNANVSANVGGNSNAAHPAANTRPSPAPRETPKKGGSGPIKHP